MHLNNYRDEKKKLTPFDISSIINDKTGRLDVEQFFYEPFIINKIFSNNKTSVFFANEMNGLGHAPKQWQFDFYYYGLDKAKRFGKWNKSEDDKEKIDLIKSYLKCSTEKAKECLDLLEPHIEDIRQDMDTGGIKNGQSRRKIE